MTIVITLVVITILALFILDMRRLAAVRCIERAERLRLRFSDLRHRLVMHAGSGEMESRERRAFEFLYHATTVMLRHPGHYALLSKAMCAALLDPPRLSEPPRLRKKDLSKATKPLVKEYVAACDDLIEQFADPVTMFVAFLSGESVVDFVRNLGARIRELEAEKQRVEQWRSVGAHALQAS